jgi:hypothetical protein
VFSRSFKISFLGKQFSHDMEYFKTEFYKWSLINEEKDIAVFDEDDVRDFVRSSPQGQWCLVRKNKFGVIVIRNYPRAIPGGFELLCCNEKDRLVQISYYDEIELEIIKDDVKRFIGHLALSLSPYLERDLDRDIMQILPSVNLMFGCFPSELAGAVREMETAAAAPALEEVANKEEKEGDDQQQLLLCQLPSTSSALQSAPIQGFKTEKGKNIFS